MKQGGQVLLMLDRDGVGYITRLFLLPPKSSQSTSYPHHDHWMTVCRTSFAFGHRILGFLLSWAGNGSFCIFSRGLMSTFSHGSPKHSRSFSQASFCSMNHTALV